MKRKVFVGVLTALVLVSFIACQNSTPMSPIYGKQVQSVTLASAPDYIYGSFEVGSNSPISFSDTIDPSEIELEVTYNDNSSEVYTGKELGITRTPVAGANTSVTVDFGYATADTGAKQFFVNIPAYKVEGISIDVSGIADTTAVLKGSDPSKTVSFDLDGVTIAAIYNGSSEKDVTDAISGNTTIDVPADFLEAEEAKECGLVSEDGETITVSQAVLDAALAAAKAELPISVAIVGSKSFTVVDAAEIVSVTGIQTVELFPGISGKDTLADADIVLTLTDAEGNEKLISNSISSYEDETGKTISGIETGWTLSYREYTADYKLTRTTTPYMVTVTATKGSESYKTDAQIPVTLTVDYATKFEAKLTDSEQTFKAEETIDEDDFTFTVTEWAGNGTNKYQDGQDPTKYDSSDFTADPSIIKRGQKDGSYIITFYLNDDPTITVTATVTVDNDSQA